MSHFKDGASRTESLLEVISNQLQLSSRLAELNSDGAKPQAPHLLNQVNQLRTKILHQRDELKITVDGW